MANGNVEHIRNWLPLVAMMCGLAVTWGSLQTQVSAHEDDLEELRANEKVHDDKETVDTIKIEVLSTKQTAILDDVAEIKGQLKEQDKKLDKIIDKLNESE